MSIPAPADLDELALVAAGFPAYHVWRSVAPGHRRYVAQAAGLGARPHTVVTDDLAELAAILSAGPQEPAP
jgi:hypothetical protein